MLSSVSVHALLPVLTTAWLAAGPAPSTPVRLAAPGLRSVGMPKEVGTFYSDHLAQQLSMQGLSVITQSEMSSMLTLERQKQLLGCSEEQSSCMAELGNALGVDGLLDGSLGKFDDLVQINVKVLSSQDGKPLALFSAQASGDKATLSELTRAARELAQQMRAKFPTRQMNARSTGSEQESTQIQYVKRPDRLRTSGVTVMKIGAAGLAAGAVVGIIGSVRERGSPLATIGWSVAGLGLATVGVGGTLYVMGRDQPVAVTAHLLPSAQGVGLAFSGNF